MVQINNSYETECPQCGRPMGLITYVGSKPTCNDCADVADYPTPTNDIECLHEKLSKHTPDHLDGAHMLVCNCPKCRTTI